MPLPLTFEEQILQGHAELNEAELALPVSVRAMLLVWKFQNPKLYKKIRDLIEYRGISNGPQS